MLGLRLGIWPTVYIYQMNRNVACHDVSTIHTVIGIVVFPSPLMGVTSIFRYCNERVCMSVRLSVRLSKKITRPNITKFPIHVICGRVARSNSDDSAIRYVLPVLWMTSCVPIMAQMARG